LGGGDEAAAVRQAAFFYLDRLLLVARGGALHLLTYRIQRTPSDDSQRAAELRHAAAPRHRWTPEGAPHSIA
jgi:hypothetical protein